jgi:perosamine synthetase
MIPLASPDIREADIDVCNQVLRSGMLIQGKHVTSFEQSIVNFAGFGHCAAVSSGTAALHLALIALGISSGDKVIVADFTFTATANVVENIGAECVFLDVHPESYVLSTDTFSKFIKDGHAKGCKALILVHEFGFPAEIDHISALAKAANLFVIEDAACALGSIANGYHVGYHADCACFSFHPRKAITCGEGGAILSRAKSLIEHIKALRNHGITLTENGTDFTKAGLNYRMTDFQAALAVSQLLRFSDELKRRHELAELYTELLSGLTVIRLPKAHPGHSWQSFMITLDNHFNRSAVIRKLLENGVQTNLGAQAIHRLDYYQKRYRHAEDDFPVASYLFDYGLVLPLYGKLTNEQIHYVAGRLKQVLSDV